MKIKYVEKVKGHLCLVYTLDSCNTKDRWWLSGGKMQPVTENSATLPFALQGTTSVSL